MTAPDLSHSHVGLSGRSLALALFGKYIILTTYGIGGIVFAVPTFVTVGSSAFALVWSGAVAGTAAFAAIGVARTWRSGKYQVEKVSTAAFVLTFLGYSFALAFRAFSDSEFGSLPLSLIPLAVCILPIIRYYSLVQTQDRQRRWQRGQS